MAVSQPLKISNRASKKEPVLTGKALRQQQFISAYILNGFHIGKACESAGIARCTFSDWRENDQAFQAAFQDAVETRLDDLEKALHDAAVKGDTTALIFALKTIGRHRGYTEHSINRQAVKLLQDAESGAITAKQAAYGFSKLGLAVPEILLLEIKRTVEIDIYAAEFNGMSTEEMERRAQERFDAVQKQREEFLPERRAEVAEIKERLKDQDSFAPEMFEGV